MTVALVTGAARRIGRTIALHLAQNGWDIGIHFHASRQEAFSLAEDLRALGRQAFLIQADFEKPQDVAALFSKLPGPVTALVNNASLFERTETDPSGTRHKQVNAHAPLALTEAFFHHLHAQAEGAVVHLLDATPLSPTLSAYAQSRALFEKEWPAQALRLAPRLRANALALGPTLKNERETEDHFADLVAQTPMKRPTAPEDVARAVLFALTTPSLLAQTLFLDGGTQAQKIQARATSDR